MALCSAQKFDCRVHLFYAALLFSVCPTPVINVLVQTASAWMDVGLQIWLRHIYGTWKFPNYVLNIVQIPVDQLLSYNFTLQILTQGTLHIHSSTQNDKFILPHIWSHLGFIADLIYFFTCSRLLHFLPLLLHHFSISTFFILLVSTSLSISHFLLFASSNFFVCFSFVSFYSSYYSSFIHLMCLLLLLLLIFFSLFPF